jgi:Protein of unknown function (DUF1269)
MASAGMLIGALAGLLVLNPLAGMAVGGIAGAGFGALSGRMADYGTSLSREQKTSSDAHCTSRRQHKASVEGIQTAALGTSRIPSR